jgi:hypothetical protein
MAIAASGEVKNFMILAKVVIKFLDGNTATGRLLAWPVLGIVARA